MGNIRVSYKNTGTASNPSLEIQEENNYYPFGLKHRGYNYNQNGRDHKYGFGGKEEQDDDIAGTQLDWLDFGARNYDASLGRWMNMDPLAYKYPNTSPYNYVLNSPLVYMDPDGQRVIVGNEDDRNKLLELLHGVYGGGNFSFNDDNELQFDGKLKDFKGDSKSTLKVLKDIIDDKDHDTFVKLSNFTDAEKKELDEKGGASTTNIVNGNQSFILLDESKLKNIELVEISGYHYKGEDGKPRVAKNRSEVPEGVESVVSFRKILDKNGKPKTVTHGGGSVAIMHEFFHVPFEGKNQRRINRFENKVRNILKKPHRPVDDSEHNLD